MNESVIQKMYPDYCLEFVGFDAKSEDAKLEFDVKTVKAFRTINEVRAMYDMEPLDTPVADMILDPTYINTAWQMSMNEEGEEEEGMPGEEEGGGFDIEGLLAGAGYGGDEPEQEEQLDEPPPEIQANEFLGKALRQVSVEVD